MENLKAFEMIFSDNGQIIGIVELDINSLRFISGDIYQYNKKLDKKSILLK